MNTKFLNKNNIIDLLFIIFGSFLGSIGVNMFLIHAKLLSGGVTGVALIFQYVFKIQAGYVILLANIPLFILSLKKLDKKFTIYSLVGTLSFSLSLILTQSISNILNINDNLLYCLYGGVINGIGFGLVFTHRGSTGGFDIVAMIIRKKYSNFNIGTISFAINLVIVTISAGIFGIPSALYTLIAMYITSFVMDKVVKGLHQSKSVFIITEKEEEVSKLILSNLNRGVTYLYGEGAYTKEEKKILYCIVPLSQLPELKNIVTNVDKKAFISISDASEVQGKGFRNGL
ncbi:YitT family protein [Clostridium thailandense]|uniref:YitT family protein n=1 Tax=Clostridium thailandense TaxID=2794346 RepID=A0A949U361_9CLOT|nr:YitT family protein [Clostridium thailandense]MBV7276541.1 YitT family protein [Clostridium thailandense]